MLIYVHIMVFTTIQSPRHVIQSIKHHLDFSHHASEVLLVKCLQNASSM